jgi:hypothetical protein
MKLFFCLVVLIVFSSQASAIFKPWQESSSPAIMSKTFLRKFSSLPLMGQVENLKKYWSSDYWPLYKGNINYRWNSSTPIGFGLVSPDYAQAVKMSQKELETLAPSEKFDLFMGNYAYPLKEEVSKKVSPHRKEWEGICHGWAAAALNHDEPIPKIVSNPDGIQIPFGSSDIKALISYYYAYHDHPVSIYQIGRRCDGRNNCGDDLNAGAFHIVLANKVGLEGKGFIADIENGKEVWNQVVFNYYSEIKNRYLSPSRSSAIGTVKVIRLLTKVRVAFNIVNNSWFPANGTALQTFKDNDYEYDLDIDRGGKIIGGEWISKDRPDFLWTVKPERDFGSQFSKLQRLLNDD